MLICNRASLLYVNIDNLVLNPLCKPISQISKSTVMTLMSHIVCVLNTMFQITRLLYFQETNFPSEQVVWVDFYPQNIKIFVPLF